MFKDINNDPTELQCESIINFICKYTTNKEYSIEIRGNIISLCELQFLVFMILAFCLIRHILAKKLFPILSDILFWDRIKFKLKFGEALFFWLYYITLWSISLHFSKKELWFWNTMYYWVPYSAYFKYKFRILFLTQLAFYISATFMLFGSARKKHSDRWMMMIHHILTSTLIISSYLAGQWRIGMIVFLLHDIADIFLELAKMMGYIQLYYVQKVVFALFLISWFVPRGGLYLWRILSSSLFESKDYVLTRDDVKLYIYFNILLAFLWGLNILWSISIIKFAFRVVKSGESRDYRSDGDDEIEETNLKKISSKKKIDLAGKKSYKNVM